LAGLFVVMRMGGGVLPAAMARAMPVQTLHSGPVGGVAGGARGGGPPRPPPPTPAERVVLAAQVARAARLMEVSYAPPGALFEVEPSAYYPALDRLADDPAR
jgi:hypothetical protein